MQETLCKAHWLSGSCAAFLGFIAAGSGCAGDNEFRTYGPFAVRSSGAGQLSSAAYPISIRTAGTLKVNYIAPRHHCASLRMHFQVDGAEKAVSGDVPPGHFTGYVDLGPVAPGNHVVSLQAEGVLGGCNTGRVTAWEGSAEVWTTLLPGDHSALWPNGLGEVVLEAGHVRYDGGFQSDGLYVVEDGTVYRYRSDAGSPPWTPTPHADGTFAEADLAEKYSHQAERLGRVHADFAAILRAAYHVTAPGDAPMVALAPLTDGTGKTGQTEWRVYRRRYANGDYDSVLIAAVGSANWVNTSPDGVALRTWFDQLVHGGYEPAPHVVCVTVPCPQPTLDRH
jgi:hypothetical protein